MAGLIFVNLGANKINLGKSAWIKCLTNFKLLPAGFWVGLIAILEIIGGFFLIAGAYTQLMALILIVICLIEWLVCVNNNSDSKTLNALYWLLIAVCLSLIFSGAGLLAIDIPNL